MVLSADDHQMQLVGASLHLDAEVCVHVRRIGVKPAIYDGPLRTLEDSPRRIPIVIAPGTSTVIVSDYYAGGTGVAGDCAGLSDAAAGGTVSPVLSFTFEG